MKIAMVSEHASPMAVLGDVDAGGQNVYVAALARELGRQGCEVVVHTRRDDPAVRRRVAFGAGVVVDHVVAGPARPVPKDHLWRHMGRFAADLAGQWAGDPPDLVHSHFWMSGAAALAAARGRVPLVQTFHALGTVKRRHQGPDDTSPADRVATERRLAATVDQVIATCTDEVRELEAMGADLGRVSVVPCGVDTELFNPRGPAWPRSPGTARIVVVTRLVPRKGADDAIRALAGVPAAELFVAGGPSPDRLDADPEVARLRSVAAACGVTERVRFLGRVARDEVPLLLRSADVVVTVPWYEPFGIVPLEAMACGVPVVASAVGGMLDSVVNGVTGLHVPSREPDALAAALRLLLDDTELRARLGCNGRERARARYTWEAVAGGVVDAYGRALAGEEGHGRRRSVAPSGGAVTP